MTPEESRTAMSDSQIALKISDIDRIILTLADNLKEQKQEIKEQWEKHDQRSDNNWKEIKEEFKDISKKLEGINRNISLLPCEVHNERIGNVNKYKTAVFGVIFTIILQSLVFAVAWGEIRKTVRNNERIINEKVLK